MASESLERATIRFHSPNALVMTLYSAYHNLFLLFQLKKPSKLLARNVKQAEKQLTEAVFMFSGFADILWATGLHLEGKMNGGSYERTDLARS